jgi:hypothetical protein
VHTGKGEKFKGHALSEKFPAGTLAHADIAAFADWLITQPDATLKSHKAGSKA